ncbi:MAG: MlaC/ttg2D family ABC transporter substrate-binding protein [Geminicoccaceae bacterium]
MTTKPTRRFVLAIGLAFIIGSAAAAPVHAQQNDDAVAFVRSLGQQAIALLADKTLSVSDRTRVFRELLLDHFDMKSIARLVMGRHWRRATAAQKDIFDVLFEDYVVATYGSRLDAYKGEQLTVGTARQATDKVMAVSSEIMPQRGPSIDVDWMLHQKDDRWYVIDVIVEGISMVISQRSEFSTVINQRGGIDGLIENIRTRIEIVSADQS